MPFKIDLNIHKPKLASSSVTGAHIPLLKLQEPSPVKQMRVSENNFGMTFVICCGYSLESPRSGDSNEYPQHNVFVKNNRKLSFNVPPYLFH